MTVPGIGPMISSAMVAAIGAGDEAPARLAMVIPFVTLMLSYIRQVAPFYCPFGLGISRGGAMCGLFPPTSAGSATIAIRRRSL
jgi:hypothetical protein